MFNKYPLQKLDCTKSIQRCCFVTLCILLLLPSLACTPHSVYYDKGFNPPVYFGRHVVREGDTLYSIAWRYGRGFKELASANNIKAPYVIQLGQKISLERPAKSANKLSKSSRSKTYKKSNVTLSKVSKQQVKSVTKNKNYKNFKHIKWQWPHLGPILAMYNMNDKNMKNKNAQRLNKSTNKGIDISGRVGESIYAAASGEVVYAGNGLLGYGNLVIINHSEVYLSAYAHNQQILVQEGQRIKIGQIIAKMGRSETSSPMLHFEIRKDGQPVNPINYLPKH